MRALTDLCTLAHVGYLVPIAKLLDFLRAGLDVRTYLSVAQSNLQANVRLGDCVLP